MGMGGEMFCFMSTRGVFSLKGVELFCFDSQRGGGVERGVLFGFRSLFAFMLQCGISRFVGGLYAISWQLSGVGGDWGC